MNPIRLFMDWFFSEGRFEKDLKEVNRNESLSSISMEVSR